MLLNCGAGCDSWEAPGLQREQTLSILKEINPECSLEGQILKLMLLYFVHLMRIEDSLEKTLMLEKCEGKRRRGRQRTRWLGSIIKATNMNLIKLREAVEDRSVWRGVVHGVTKSHTQQLNNKKFSLISSSKSTTEMTKFCPIVNYSTNHVRNHALL